MKKILFPFAILVFLVTLFASCEAESTSNPYSDEYSGVLDGVPGDLSEDTSGGNPGNTTGYGSFTVYDFAAAQESGGVYLKNDRGEFYKAIAGGEFLDTKTIEFFDKDDPVLVLDNNKEAVVFLSDRIEQVVAFPILQEGYALPFNVDWSNDYQGWYTCWRELNGGTKGLKSKIADCINSLREAGFFRNEWYDNYGFSYGIEEINGEPFQDFMNAHMLKEYDFCSGHIDASWFPHGYTENSFLRFESDEPITFSFYQGTQYAEVTVEPMLRYYAIDGCKKNSSIYGNKYYYDGISIPVEMTKEGYAVLDFASAPAGKLVLRIITSAGYYGYVIENASHGSGAQSGQTGTEAGEPSPISQLQVQPAVLIEEAQRQRFTVTAEPSLNFRTGPGTSYDKLGTLPTGSVVTVIGKSEDVKDWVVIEYQDEHGQTQVGWVSAEYIA